MGQQFVPPIEVADGDSWTAAKHNNYIRGNLQALWPYQAAGDLAVSVSANEIQRLAAAAASGKRLQSSAANVFAWTNKPVYSFDNGIIAFTGIQFSGCESAASTSWVTVYQGVSKTLSRASTLVLIAAIPFHQTNAGATQEIKFTVDSTDLPSLITWPATYYTKTTFIRYISLEAGSHTFYLKHRLYSGSGYAYIGRYVSMYSEYNMYAQADYFAIPN